MKIAIYDATLTESARHAGAQLSVRDRMRIALRLAEVGVAWIEAGWPGGERGGGELFAEVRRLETGGARLCACAALAARGRVGAERELAAALRSGAPAVTLMVEVAGSAGGPGCTPAHLGAAVHAVVRDGRAALVQLEGAFGAGRAGAGAVHRLVAAAAEARAAAIVLSDPAGGALPHEVEERVVAARRAARGVAVGVRARDDAGVAVANSLAAVRGGATLVAATVNGYGERCGAADLVAVAAALELKMGHQALAPGQLRRLGALAHFVAELADREIPGDQPYVGRDAFTIGDIARPHVDPERVGSRAEAPTADERGHPGAVRAARALGLPARGEAQARRVLARLAAWEKRGFRYEGAEASFELLLRELAGRRHDHFQVLGYRVIDARRGGRGFTEATAEAVVGGEHLHTAAVGVGPVNALDRALRGALERHYPELAGMQIVQSRSRNLASGAGTAGPVRVVLESADARDRWGTAGVSENLLEACWQALVDATEYKLLKDDVQPKGGGRRRTVKGVAASPGPPSPPPGGRVGERGRAGRRPRAGGSRY